MVLIHQAQWKVGWESAGIGRGLPSDATSESHFAGGCSRGTRNYGRACQCVLGGHATNDQQGCKNLEAVDVRL